MSRRSKTRTEGHGKSWVTVVEPAPPPEAREAWMRWRRDHPELSRRLSDDDVRFDHLCGSEGQRVRVSVLLERGGG
ncbi:MAG: hypothetical protein AAF533_00990 [Acidobacteriota bacterium]